MKKLLLFIFLLITLDVNAIWVTGYFGAPYNHYSPTISVTFNPWSTPLLVGSNGPIDYSSSITIKATNGYIVTNQIWIDPGGWNVIFGPKNEKLTIFADTTTNTYNIWLIQTNVMVATNIPVLGGPAGPVGPAGPAGAGNGFPLTSNVSGGGNTISDASFVGDGSGLTNLNSLTNTQTGVTLGGTFNGIFTGTNEGAFNLSIMNSIAVQATENSYWAGNSNYYSNSFIVTTNSGIPVYFGQTNGISAGQQQSITQVPTNTDRLVIVGNGPIIQINTTSITGSNVTYYNTNHLQEASGLNNGPIASGKYFGTNLYVLYCAGVTSDSSGNGTTLMCASNMLIVVNSDTLASMSYIQLDYPTFVSNGITVNCSNAYNAMTYNPATGLAYFGIQNNLGNGSATNSSIFYPGCAPFYDSIAVYSATPSRTNTAGQPVWPFLGMLEMNVAPANRVGLQNVFGLAFNTNDNYIYEFAYDILNNSASTIFRVSLDGNKIPIFVNAEGQTQDATFTTNGPFLLTATANKATNSTVTYDVSGSNLCFSIARGIISFTGGNGGNSTVWIRANQHSMGIGSQTGVLFSTGQDDTFVGDYAGNATTTGSDNTFVGHNAGVNNTTGNNNVALGSGAGAGGNGSGNISLGTFSGNAANINNNINIGNNGVASQDGVIRIGTNGTHTVAYIAGVIYGNGGGLTNTPIFGSGVTTNANGSYTITGDSINSGQYVSNNSGVGTNITSVNQLIITNGSSQPTFLFQAPSGAGNGGQIGSYTGGVLENVLVFTPGTVYFRDSVLGNNPIMFSNINETVTLYGNGIVGTNLTVSNNATITATTTTSNILGNTNNYTGFITNGASKVKYYADASALCYTVSFTNTGFSSWQTVGNRQILFTNFHATTKNVNICQIQDANGQFTEDFNNSAGIATEVTSPIGQFIDLSTTSYDVFGVFDTAAGGISTPPISNVPWLFNVMVLGNQ